MAVEFFKFMCKIVSALYIGFIMTYFLSDFTHSFFGCQEHYMVDSWRCTVLHIITLVCLGFMITGGLLILFLSDKSFNTEE